MTHAKRARVVFLFSAVLVTGMLLALVLEPLSVEATHFRYATYTWTRTSATLDLSLGTNASSTWAPHLVLAASDWSLSSLINLGAVPGGTTGAQCRPSFGRVEVCSATYGQTGWAMLVQAWAADQHVVQATVRLNDSYLGAAPYNTPAWRNHLMCKGLGQALGLVYADGAELILDSCLKSATSPDLSQHPSIQDIEQLAEMYDHMDRELPEPLPPSVTDSLRIDPQTWGTLLYRSNNGRDLIYGHSSARNVRTMAGRTHNGNSTGRTFQDRTYVFRVAGAPGT